MTIRIASSRDPGDLPTLRWATALAGLLSLAPAAVSAASAPVIPGAVLPGLGQDARRSLVDVESVPWRGVVRVQTEVGTRCSGALIAERTVLTAAHCLYGRNTGRLLRPGSVHILLGYDRGAYTAHTRAVSFATGRNYALGFDMQPLPQASPDGDWAVIALDAPLGTADRVLPLLRWMPPAGTPVVLGGYEQDRAQAMVADLACTVTGLVREPAGGVMLRHSCGATRGASGAPLLVRTLGGQWGIIGVASRAFIEAKPGVAPRAFIGTTGGVAVPDSAINLQDAVVSR